MSGALLQLVSKGGQDVWLTGHPEITFFTSIHKRHTNFAMQEMEVNFEDTPTMGKESRIYIPRQGDLLANCTLEFLGNTNPDTGTTDRWWSYYPAEQAISEVKLYIGSQLIESYDQWYPRIWTEWNYSETEKESWRRMTNSKRTLGTTGRVIEDDGTMLLKYPLLFNCCRNMGSSLPLIALQYMDTSLEISFSAPGTSVDKCRNISEITECKLWCNYIYLDTEERYKFAHTSHDYLIEQVQWQRSPINVSQGAITDINLKFQHPCKYLMWCLSDGNWGNLSSSEQVYGNTGFSRNANTVPLEPRASCQTVGTARGESASMYYLNNVDTANPTFHAEYQYWISPQGNGVISSVELLFDGVPKIAQRKGDAFHYNQAWNYFKTFPAPGYYAYSFALAPTEYQPSGNCNFSKINDVHFIITAGHGSVGYKGITTDTLERDPPGNIEIWAVTYNVLHIESGMGGLKYDN